MVTVGPSDSDGDAREWKVRGRSSRSRKEYDMALMKKTREDLEWPTWLGQRLGDWPEAWKSLADATLKVEEFEDDGHLVVRAEMPGIDPDKDVEITVTDHRSTSRPLRSEVGGCDGGNRHRG
jgi:hypothetical protein